MSTSPVATTVSDAGPAEAVAAGAWVGAGPQPVSTATPSAASAIRIRPMRCPLPTAGMVEGATAPSGAAGPAAPPRAPRIPTTSPRQWPGVAVDGLQGNANRPRLPRSGGEFLGPEGSETVCRLR